MGHTDSGMALIFKFFCLLPVEVPMFSGGEETLFTQGLDYIPRSSAQKWDSLLNHCMILGKLPNFPICKSHKIMLSKN